MSLLKRTFNEVLILGICLISPLSGEAKDLALRLADDLFAAGHHTEAITEYKRFIYFNPGDERVSDAYFQIGMAYRDQGMWEEAIDAFRMSIATTTNNTLRDERKIDIGITLIASRRYSAAELELLRVFTFTKDSSLKRRAAFFLGVSYIYRFKWKEARKMLDEYFRGAKVPNRQRIQLLLESACGARLKSPRLARVLSCVLPGAGQIYVGNWLSGLNSMAINIGTGYLLLDALLDQRYRDIVLFNLSLFVRYYLGGVRNAELLAVNYNKSINEMWVKRILKTLHSETLVTAR
jgi:tetratricopeptide (TPR) repeat protein